MLVRSQSFWSLERLDRKLVDCLINCILIYSENDIEIVWNYGVG